VALDPCAGRGSDRGRVIRRSVVDDEDLEVDVAELSMQPGDRCADPLRFVECGEHERQPAGRLGPRPLASLTQVPSEVGAEDAAVGDDPHRTGTGDPEHLRQEERHAPGRNGRDRHVDATSDHGRDRERLRPPHPADVEVPPVRDPPVQDPRERAGGGDRDRVCGRDREIEREQQRQVDSGDDRDDQRSRQERHGSEGDASASATSIGGRSSRCSHDSRGSVRSLSRWA
jgi:hypothetical protein